MHTTIGYFFLEKKINGGGSDACTCLKKKPADGSLHSSSSPHLGESPTPVARMSMELRGMAAHTLPTAASTSISQGHTPHTVHATRRAPSIVVGPLHQSPRAPRARHDSQPRLSLVRFVSHSPPTVRCARGAARARARVCVCVCINETRV